VLVELGYALYALGPARLLLVLNTAYGEPEQLPFDLRMRRTLSYRMPENVFGRSGERKKLARDFEVALRAIFHAETNSTMALATTSGSRGKRIGTVIQLMNKAWGSENFPVSSIAEMLGMEYINELENYIDGVAEPSIPFLERFCERFGVCPEWLKHGRLPPFTVEYINNPLECLERIRALKPEWIFFVRSRDPRGEVGIVAKIADKKYVTISGDWVISSQVGAGGARRMYDSTSSSKNCGTASYGVISLVDCTTPTISTVYFGGSAIPDLWSNQGAITCTGGMISQIPEHHTLHENSLKSIGAESLFWRRTSYWQRLGTAGRAR
jgi:hypothetical protein